MNMGRMYTFLEWGGMVDGYRMAEMEAAPSTTPSNTPDMGNAQPATVNSDGSGDIFSGDGKKKRKKKINESKTMGTEVGKRDCIQGGGGEEFDKNLAREFDNRKNSSYGKE